jgi:hypothetical protein
VKHSDIVSIVVVVITISTADRAEIAAAGEFEVSGIERFSLSQRCNFIEFSVINVLKLENDSQICFLVMMSCDHGQTCKVDTTSPPNLVCAVGQIWK